MRVPRRIGKQTGHIKTGGGIPSGKENTMTIENWIGLITCVLAGIATAVPLIVQLVKYIKEAIREKNWSRMLKLVMSLMEEAEGMFEAGVDRKIWVLTALDNLSETIDYDIDKEAVADLIDALCTMSKIVNAPKR